MTLRKNLWQFVVLGLAVSLALTIYADFNRLVHSLRFFDWYLLPVVLGLTLGNQLMRFLKWEYLLGEVDVNLPLSTSFHVFGSGLIMIMTPGKLGEVWKSWLINEVDQTPISTTIPVVATERITDVLGVTLISSVGVLAFDRSPLFVVLLFGPLVAGVVLLQFEGPCLRILDLLERLPIIGKRVDGLRNVYTNSRDLLRPRPLLVTTTLSVASWSLECVGLWVVLQGFGVDFGVLAASFVFTVASLLGAVSLLPGGLGVTEGSMTGLLLVFGVGRTTAASSTVIIRAATLWFVAGFALLVYASFRHRYSFEIPDEETEA
jgi:uncharacterized protein (TIRG00374 family)